MFKYDDDWDDVPIGAPFHSDIYFEKDEKTKNNNDDYAPIGAPYHHDDD